jgi:cytochrome c biogenesis protein CcdA
MATNVAAISYIGREVGTTRRVLLCGVSYALGRVLVYVALASVLVAGLLAVPDISNFLQKYLNKLLGPILIVSGMFLLELLSFRGGGPNASEGVQRRLASAGIVGAGLLGVVFAAAFCPVSAALFFGSLLPLAVKHRSPLLLPSVYGIATGLPVVAFAVLIAVSAGSVGKAFHALTRVDWWARRVTGVLFILVGVYYSLIYVFGVQLPR